MVVELVQAPDIYSEPIRFNFPALDGTRVIFQIERAKADHYSTIAAIERGNARARANGKVADGDMAMLEKYGEKEYAELMIGEANLKLLEDAAVDAEWLNVAVTTAAALHMYGQEVAVANYELMIAQIERQNAERRGEVVDPTPAPNRAARRTKTKTASPSTRTRSSAKATVTRSPVSSSGTTSRKVSSRTR